LTLVSAVNNGGYPGLYQDDRPIQKAQNDNDRETRNSVLNAVASILVENHKIIAVAAQNPLESCAFPPPANKTTDEDEPQDQAPPEILCPATHESNGTFSVKRLSQHFLEVTVVCNPKDLDQYFEDANPDICMLVNPGTSQITIAKSGKWVDILSLPWVVLSIYFQKPWLTSDNAGKHIHLRTMPPQSKTTCETSSPHRVKTPKKLFL
jgi:hypothetical protein